MADFLFGFKHDIKRQFCASGYAEHLYWFSFRSDKVSEIPYGDFDKFEPALLSHVTWTANQTGSGAFRGNPS